MSGPEASSALAGALIVAGFEGPRLDRDTTSALAEGRRAGLILFRRNIESVEQVRALTTEIVRAAESALSPFVCVDQEGGRVARLAAPVVELPPMRVLGDIGDPALTRRAGEIVGRELAALGFNVDFAPVLDVDSNPQNPVIGDRSFGRDAERVTSLAIPFGEGLESSGVLACGKHFPGHGDTDKDSHFDLPIVHQSASRLRAVELPPFAAAASRLGSFMTAHVVYEALDPDVPATLSRAIVTDLLRGELGFSGVLFSDDLEMRALADRYDVEDSAVEAVRAGCDVVLVCQHYDLAERAHAALVEEIERDAAFRRRAVEARARTEAARRRFPARPATSTAELLRVLAESGARELVEEIARRRS
jgi:beta-N-acetylhexosaminidase